MILILGLSTIVLSPVEGQSNNWQESLDKNKQEIEDMLGEMEGYMKISELRKLIDEYRTYLKPDTASLTNGEKLHQYYVEIGDKLLSLAPRYDPANFKRRLNIIKTNSAKIKSEKDYRKWKKEFVVLKRRYKNNKPGFWAMLNIFKKNKGKIGMGDIYREIGGGLLSMDEYIEDFGKKNRLDSLEMDNLKRDPARYITLITMENIERYEELEVQTKELEKERKNLDYSTKIIVKLTASLENQNVILAKHNSDLASVRSSKEQALQSLADRENELKTTSDKYENRIQQKITELDLLKSEADTLREFANSSANNFVTKQEELHELEKIYNELRTDTDSLQKEKARIVADKKELEEAKETAENGRMIFLLSTIILLLGMLSYVFLERWNTIKENKRLLEEKAILEKILKKNKAGFYDEYAKTSKAELAVQRERLRDLTEKLQESQKQIVTERNKLSRQNIVMLRELNHRTKNNLQMISSILGIQSMSVKDKKAKEVLLNSKSRIHAIGLIHKGMYTEAFDEKIQVKMKYYVDNLVDSLSKSFQFGTQVAIQKEVEDIVVQPDKALPIGLIINEVVTNAFKHAFYKQPKPKLKIILRHKSNQELYLSIQDNGKGMNSNNTNTKSFGLKMIEILSDELEGRQWFENDNGLKFSMTFPIKYTLNMKEIITEIR